MCEWQGLAKAALEDLWREKYMPTGLLLSQATTTTTGPVLAPTHITPNKFTKQKNSLKAKVPTTLYQDEYTRYYGLLPHHDFKDVRDQWLAPEQQAIYPNLSKMALNLLSIPVISTEPERLFSSCKITVTDRRNKLSVKVIKALECLRSQYKVKAFKLEEEQEVEGRGRVKGSHQVTCNYTRRITPYYAVRMRQEVYYCSAIQYVFLGWACTAVRNKV